MKRGERKAADRHCGACFSFEGENTHVGDGKCTNPSSVFYGLTVRFEDGCARFSSAAGDDVITVDDIRANADYVRYVLIRRTNEILDSIVDGSSPDAETQAFIAGMMSQGPKRSLLFEAAATWRREYHGHLLFGRDLPTRNGGE